jgi:hypothetical protein
VSATTLKALCLAGVALLVAAKAWAGLTGDLAATMAGAGDDPWGVVSLVMLYTGLVAFLIVLVRFEPDRRIALGVIALTPLIGNAALALWLAARGLERFRAPGRTAGQRPDQG